MTLDNSLNQLSKIEYFLECLELRDVGDKSSCVKINFPFTDEEIFNAQIFCSDKRFSKI